MGSTGIENIPHSRGTVRVDASAPLTAGAGTITFPPVPAGFEWRVSTITVAATGVTAQPAGMVAAAYLNSTTIPEALIGWDMIAAPAPGLVLDAAVPVAVRGGESVLVTITSGGAAPAVNARVTAELVEVEVREWPTPAPVQIVATTEPLLVDPVSWQTAAVEG